MNFEERNKYQRFSAVISELKVGKENENKFGKYNYRTCGDILEAVKPLCFSYEVLITMTDDIVMVADRIYVKAIAEAIDCRSGEVISSAQGFAREAPIKKGMDDSQITGSASTYARKYALNALLSIDDTKDADAGDNTKNHQEARSLVIPFLKTFEKEALYFCINSFRAIKEGQTLEDLSDSSINQISQRIEAFKTKAIDFYDAKQKQINAGQENLPI